MDEPTSGVSRQTKKQPHAATKASRRYRQVSLHEIHRPRPLLNQSSADRIIKGATKFFFSLTSLGISKAHRQSTK